MATIREIRTRIKAVRNIEKITRAMKLVAAARLKRATSRVAAARPYAEHMQAMMRDLAAAAEVENPLLEVREERNIALLVVTSDRGLCGSYNTNLLRRAMELLRPRDPKTVKLVVVGRKAAGFFRRQPYEVFGTHAAGAEARLTEARELANQLRTLFIEKQVDAVYLVYARFVNAMRQVPEVLQLLPLKAPAAEQQASGADMIFEPDAGQLLESLLPRYVDTQIYRVLAEAIASEHGARMTSMSAATENAGTMIDTLTLTMNRARQAAITKEISEIVTGAEALK